MAWARKSSPASKAEPQPTLIGLDLNATRARAVQGPAHVLPRTLPLAGTQEDLPMILSLKGRQAEVGRAGVALCRLLPHLTCADFLAHLGESREWHAGRHRLDAVKALALVFAQLAPAIGGAQGVVLAVPAYLTQAQVMLLPPLAEMARLPLLGTVQAPLATALAAYLAQPWSGVALVVDGDEHSLTAAAVLADGDQLSVRAVQSCSQLSLRIWKGRLIDAIADRCIRQSRRDPRDCAPAEQALYEQIENALDAGSGGKAVEFLLQTNQWYQHLLLRPEEFTAYCDRLVGQMMQAIQEMLTANACREALRIVLVSRAAGRLPGLVAALHKAFAERLLAAEIQPSGDFGEDLLAEHAEPAASDFGEELLAQRAEPVGVVVLSADASAQAAHQLAARFLGGELSRGHLDFSIPLPKSEAPSATGESKKKSFRLLSFDL
jgi:molecular chaperone DnaK (HSP70)